MAFLDQVSALADQYFKNGGMVAKFQEGGDVDDDYGTFGADELGASVEDTAASEDIGTRDDDEDIDFPDEFEVPDPDKYDYGPGPDDGGDGDDQRVVSETVLGDGPTAAEAIEAVRGPAVDPAIQEAIKTQAAVQAALATKTPVSKEEESVTEKALQVDEFGPLFDTPATRPTVPAGGIAELEPEFQQARTPDELDEIQDFEDMAAAQQAAGVGLQGKKAGLAGLGVLAGSPMLAAAPVARDIFKTLTQPDVKAGELLAGKGLGRNQTVEEVVNDKGQRVGVVVSDPTGVVSIQPTSISNAFDPALRDAYSKLNERESREREGRGDDREPITEEDVAVEEVEAAPKKPPTIDIIPFRPEDFYYLTQQQRQGLPSMMNMRRS